VGPRAFNPCLFFVAVIIRTVIYLHGLEVSVGAMLLEGADSYLGLAVEEELNMRGAVLSFL